MDPRTRPAWVVAAFAAALDLALVVCAYGFVSLLTDVEVIASPDAGLLVGPGDRRASVAAVLLHLAHTLRRPDRHGRASVLLAALWTLARRRRRRRPSATRSPPARRSRPCSSALGFGIGWFGLLIPALAALVASFAVLVARGQAGGMERPRWPWERDDEE